MIQIYCGRPNKIVIARSEALHRMVFRAKRRGNLMGLILAKGLLAMTTKDFFRIPFCKASL
jgi:hypothetical protein